MFGRAAAPWLRQRALLARSLHAKDFVLPIHGDSLVTAFFSSTPDLQRRLLQAREQSAYSAGLSIIFGILTILLNLLFVVGFGLGGLGVLWVGLIVSVIFTGVAFYNHRQDLRGRFSAAKLRSALGYGLPLLPHHAAAWANQSVGRWVLGGVMTMGDGWAVGGSRESGLAALPNYWRFRQCLLAGLLLLAREADARRSIQRSAQIARLVLVLGVIAVLGCGNFRQLRRPAPHASKLL